MILRPFVPALALAAVLMAPGALAGKVAARGGAGEALPGKVRVEGRTLRLNGQAVFRKFFLKLYAIGLYLERPSQDAEEIIRSDRAKRLQLRLMRDVSGEQIANLLRWRLREVEGGDPELLAEFEELFKRIPDAKAGSDFTVTYVPGRGTALRAGKVRVELSGKRFADALFKIWLGPDDWAGKTRPALLGQ